MSQVKLIGVSDLKLLITIVITSKRWAINPIPDLTEIVDKRPIIHYKATGVTHLNDSVLPMHL